MNIPIELYIVGLILIVLLFIFTVGVDYTIPMLERAKFDNACNASLAIIQKNGGLSAADMNSLTVQLNEIGINNVSISAPTTGKWGNNVTLRVVGEYVFLTTNYPDLSKKSISKHLVYENSTRNLCLN